MRLVSTDAELLNKSDTNLELVAPDHLAVWAPSTIRQRQNKFIRNLLWCRQFESCAGVRNISRMAAANRSALKVADFGADSEMSSIPLSEFVSHDACYRCIRSSCSLQTERRFPFLCHFTAQVLRTLASRDNDRRNRAGKLSLGRLAKRAPVSEMSCNLHSPRGHPSGV